MLLAAAVEVAEVDVDLDAVVAVVASAVIFPMMRIHQPLLTKVVLKKEIPGMPQKDVVMVHLVGLIVVVVVAVEVLAMVVKMAKMDAHEGHMNAAVGLDEEMTSNEMVLDVATGVHSPMTLLR